MFHLCVARFTDRDAARAQLASAGVATAVHYPLAITQQPAYRDLAGPPCPVAESWAAECVSVPCFPELTDAEVETVADALAASCGMTESGVSETGRNPNVTAVSAFFPCYNDELSIPTMVRDARAALQQRVDDFEIIVVDDGSADGSVAVLEALTAEVPELRIVRHETNRGYGGALISGFAAATRPWVFYTDGDAQYDASELVRCIDAVQADTDIVQGWKMGRGDQWYRKIIGRAYHHVVRIMFRLTHPRHRLRLPVDPPDAARPGRADVDHGRDLRRDDAQVHAGRRPVRRGRCEPPRPPVRALAVLPDPGRRPVAARPREAVVGPRRATRA